MPTELETQVIEETEAELMEEQKKNLRFFERNKEMIRGNYPKKYVVIKSQEIIDSGLDAGKLNDKYPGENILIATYFETLNAYLESPLADSPNEYS